MNVDRDAEMPPYLQVPSEPRRQIESGELPPGARMPSITRLMQTYGIAKNTACRAVEVLTDDGLVSVRQGWGTFVKRPEQP